MKAWRKWQIDASGGGGFPGGLGILFSPKPTWKTCSQHRAPSPPCLKRSVHWQEPQEQLLQKPLG